MPIARRPLRAQVLADLGADELDALHLHRADLLAQRVLELQDQVGLGGDLAAAVAAPAAASGAGAASSWRSPGNLSR